MLTPLLSQATGPWPCLTTKPSPLPFLLSNCHRLLLPLLQETFFLLAPIGNPKSEATGRGLQSQSRSVLWICSLGHLPGIPISPPPRSPHCIFSLRSHCVGSSPAEPTSMLPPRNTQPLDPQFYICKLNQTQIKNIRKCINISPAHYALSDTIGQLCPAPSVAILPLEKVRHRDGKPHVWLTQLNCGETGF